MQTDKKKVLTETHFVRTNLLFIMKSSTRQNWDQDEICLLHDLVNEKGKKWEEISRFFPSRSGDSIRNFYIRRNEICRVKTSSSQHVAHVSWSFEEDVLIIAFVQKNGKLWTTLGKKFAGKRTVHAIRNRYSRLMKLQNVYAVTCMCRANDMVV